MPERRAIGFAAVCLLVSILVMRASALEKRDSAKIGRMAVFISAELSNKGVRTVVVKLFTGAGGKETKESRAAGDEFLQYLSKSAGNMVIKTSGAADAVITGTLTPYRGGVKRQLSIKAQWSSTGRTITSYSAVLK